MRISKLAVAMVTVLFTGPTARFWRNTGATRAKRARRTGASSTRICNVRQWQESVTDRSQRISRSGYEAAQARLQGRRRRHRQQRAHGPDQLRSWKHAIGGRPFELKQFHFHAPSENKINGKQFPLESHLVHADKDGNLAVVAVMFQEGAANTLLGKLWEKMPNKAGEKSALPTGLSVSQLLPKERDYYRFNGSLTTPPCSEGVRWFVIKNPAYGIRRADPAVFQGNRVRQQSPDPVDKRALRPAIAVKLGSKEDPKRT